MDPVANFLGGKTVRRAIAVALFVGLLVAFRKLVPLLVFFIIFERGIGTASTWIARRTRLSRKRALFGLVGAFLAAIGGGITVGIGRLIPLAARLREALPAKMALIRDSALYQQLQSHLDDADSYLDAAKHYATNVIGYLTGFGHLLVYATLGFILAVVYLLEEEELDAWVRSIPGRSLGGTLLRWFGHLADAVALTIQLQLVVAGFNAVFTLPILLVLHIPHAGLLALAIFASSLVPVIGNLVMGVILSLLAYQARGWLGVGVFVALTFVLHKIESYYLTPRLTSRHVRLPGFVLVLSLVACEHLFGFVGLFVSFPALFVATRIRAELAEEDRAPVEQPANVGSL